MFGLKKRRRNIFRYHNGYQWVFGDPLAIANALDSDPVYRNDVHPNLSTSDNDREAAAAFVVCVKAFRTAFNLRAFDPSTGHGLVDQQVLQLHFAYCDFMSSLKKSTSSPATSQPSGDATSNPSSSETIKST